MVSGVWGKKVGMTQLFTDEKVIPATAIDVSNWFVTNIRTTARDGYDAIQVGCVRKRYVGEAYSAEWLKNLKKYFEIVREIKLENPVEGIEVGKVADFFAQLEAGQKMDACGRTRGRGFAGVVKRLNYTGGRGSHGCTMGRRPGSSSWWRAEGRVRKGKGMPGHLGNVQRVSRNLEIVRVEREAQIVLVKGSIPGHSGSLIFLRKSQ